MTEDTEMTTELKLYDPPQNIPPLEEVLGIDPEYFDRPAPPMVQLLYGAGPSITSKRVALACALNMQHLGYRVGMLMENAIEMMRYIVQSPNATIGFLNGGGSYAMEACFASLLDQDDHVLVCDTGTFTARMREQLSQIGVKVTVVRNRTGESVKASTVDDVLSRDNNITHLAIAHGATSSGVENVELPMITKLAKSKGCITIVDAVPTLGSRPILMNRWDIDALFVASQKSLGAHAGIGIVALSEEAMRRITGRSKPPVQWSLNLARILNFCKNPPGYHVTFAISNFLGLYEALREVTNEGLKQRWLSHYAASRGLQKAMQHLGFEPLVQKPSRLHPVVAFKMRPDMEQSANEYADWLDERMRVVVAPSFDYSAFRAGQMAGQIDYETSGRFLGKMHSSLGRLGVISPPDLDEAMAAYDTKHRSTLAKGEEYVPNFYLR